MPRAAGSSSHYEFALQRNGRTDRSVTIKLPSVTHILSATLAKPQLVPWAYKITRDNICGLASLVQDDMGEGYWADFQDILTDEAMLADYMKENRLRPEDVANDAAERGTENHGVLEQLCKAYLEHGDEASDEIATRIQRRNPDNGWAQGLCDWWQSEYPRVLNAEDVLFSLKHGYAGSVDLIWSVDGGIRVTDLKTRGTGKTHYPSDHVQVDGYTTAYEEMTGYVADSRSVLIVTEDGKFEEGISTIPRGTFLQVKAVYDALKGAR